MVELAEIQAAYYMVAAARTYFKFKSVKYMIIKSFKRDL